jgi:hypothetical protein
MKGIVEIVALNDSYHNVTIDRQRQVVVDRVKDFVAATVRAGRGEQRVMRFAGMPAAIRSQAVA